ncbi:unnamed protein product [Prorocentrum cordatum]|uniref:Subtilisin n=1 Tax=Prorocentrum cordatum TaxID=2364126 RepID=A0ABN9PC90_9DINO|nr:unnamed protein product [Polarella glacialis]
MLYIDGLRLASDAWYGLCYSTAFSRANAEAACSADPDCYALHDTDCAKICVRYCYSVIGGTVAKQNGTNRRSCTYVKNQLTTASCANTSHNASGLFVGPAGSNASCIMWTEALIVCASYSAFYDDSDFTAMDMCCA